MSQGPQSPNLLLASLAPADFAVLQPHLKSVRLPQESVLLEAGSLISRVYFPHDGVVSIVAELSSGETIECAMVGREGLVGGASGLGQQASVCKAIVQIAGTASALDSDRLRSVASTNSDLRGVLFRHEQLLLVQALQSGACIASHSVEARLARWLLRCRDLQASDDLPLTQEFLGEMLSVRRTSVSLVANTFSKLA